MKKKVIRKQIKMPIIATLLAVGFLSAISVRQTIADSWNANRVDRAQIKAYYDPSVATYGYTGMFDTAIGQ